MTLNSDVAALAVSDIRRFEEQTKAIPGILRLTLGEPDFATPDLVKRAAIRAIEENYSHYSPMGGDHDLKKAAANYFALHDRVHYDPATEIIVTVGATEAIAVCLKTVLNTGSALLLPTPSYPGYDGVARLLGAPVICIDTAESGFKLTPEALRRALIAHPELAAIVLNYPNNPTGVTYCEEELRALIAVIREKKLYVISDEIYSALTFSGNHTSIAALYRERTLLINGVSKSHAMTGWRIGFILAPAGITQQLVKVHQFYVTGAATMAQRAAICALEACEGATAMMRTAYAARANYLVDAVTDLGFHAIRPQGGFYVFAEIPPAFQTEDASDFCLRLAKHGKVALIPGTAFGAAYTHYVRFSFAASLEKLQEAVRRIRHFLEKEVKNNG
ncbi:MAG: aminotransferase class I/II-fold pyridoxal phosphate-dependent enzyme [Sporolactobacillus sp.]